MRIKSFDELTIQDNFIFQKVMLKKPICKAVLERLLDISIKDIVYIQEEKTLDVSLETKSVRLDVYVNDDKGTVFNIEMQTSKDMEELVKRTRFYQSILDMYHLHINAIIRMYRNDDIRMYKFHYLSDTICMR